jgi:predicted phosphodiesterase
MKIAILSDIHGNMPALKVVTADIAAWQPDLVVVNGDVVNRGPCSLACLQWVQAQQQAKGWQVLSGNHEGFVLACGLPDAPQSGPAYEVARFAHWTYAQLQGTTDGLIDLPTEFSWTAPDGRELRATHASMHDNRYGISVKAPPEEVRKQIAPPPAVFVTSHTHQAFMRRVAETLVVNIGSVGSPFDLDARASYGRFTWSARLGWQAEIVRLPFDRMEIERDYVTSGFLAEAGALTQLMLVELRKSRGLMFRWASRHYDQVMAGEISVEATVRDILRDDDVRPFTGAPGWEIT